MTDSTLPTADATKGADPVVVSTTTPTEKEVVKNNLDLTKITDEDFEKVFDDPRLFKHTRFQQLNQRAKQAEALEKKQREAEDAILKEQAKWQELAEKRETEAKTWQEKYTSRTIDNAIQLEASKAGAVDVDAVLKLIARDGLAVDDTGAVSGVSEAVKALIEAKPYLKTGTAPTKIGDSSAPGNPGETAPKRFKASQLNNVTFYRENEKDIMTAMRLGLIDDDMAN